VGDEKSKTKEIAPFVSHFNPLKRVENSNDVKVRRKRGVGWRWGTSGNNSNPSCGHGHPGGGEGRWGGAGGGMTKNNQQGTSTVVFTRTMTVRRDFWDIRFLAPGEKMPWGGLGNGRRIYINAGKKGG